MGFYLRKSFRAGPVRINLSKSGLGVSAGVKCARIGVGPRGAYVHAGRSGLYYRQQLATSRGQRTYDSDGEGCAKLLLMSVLLSVGVLVVAWLILNPLVLAAVAGLVIAFLAIRWWSWYRRARQLAAYKALLDVIFVSADARPGTATLADVLQKQRELPSDTLSTRQIERIESDVYQGLLDKVLDDRTITRQEADAIAAADRVLRIDEMTRLRIKREIFSAAYVDVIQDRQVTEGELAWLQNLVAGLAIPLAHVQREHSMVRDIMAAQALKLPLQALSADKVSAPIQTSEQVYYQASAQVLSKRKSRQSSSGFEYSVRRDGTIVVTNKRVFVTGNGTTSIRFSEIEELEVDLDDDVIEIVKTGSGRPIVLKPVSPILVGRIIELLTESSTGSM